MIWENPAYLWLLLLIPLLAGGIWWYQQHTKELRRRYFSDELFQSLRRGYWQLGDKLKLAGLFGGLLFLALAIAGPKVGTEVREVKRQGVDLLMALDLSASMNAEDVRPSRLGKAKYEIERLIERLRGDRVGLVVFTGEAYLQAPMTLDYSALRLFLNIVETNQMPSSTTDLGAAMETALQAFQSIEQEGATGNAAKVLLIVSDGEDQGEEYRTALENLVKNNITVYAIGIGTREGEVIPLYEDKTGKLIGYKRDRSGRVVTTKLEPETLRSIASEGGGRYYEISSGSSGIDAFLGHIDELEQGEFSSQEYADFKNQYQWMAGIALAFLVLSLTVSNFKNSRES